MNHLVKHLIRYLNRRISEVNDMAKKIIEFVKNKETKNTIRYGEEKGEGRSNISGSLYIMKSMLNNDVPESIMVTIEY